MGDIPDRVLQAHGGARYWESLSGIEVEMSARGLLFAAKRVPPLRHARLTVDTRSPQVVLHDYPAPGRRARLHGDAGVEILDAAGRSLQRRERPRDAFGTPRRLLRWDALDFAHFCGYAMWGYLTVPFLLRDPRVRVRPCPEGRAESGDCLEAEFPADLPTTRRVHPRGPGGRPLPWPTLVAIDIHDLRPAPARG